MKFRKIKLSSEEIEELETTSNETEQDPGEEEMTYLFLNGGETKEEKPSLRMTGIYGPVDEERASEVIYNLHALMELGKTCEPNPDNEEEILCYHKPIKFVVSTTGGSAFEMFSMYDTIRDLSQYCEIETIGLGKVMSAGVLLLAAGEKGKRKVGKHCRIMIHGVAAGQHGYIQDVENEMNEMKQMQDLYIKALSDETNMSEAHLKKLMDRRSNVYLTAQEAVDLGIADEVI